MTPELSDQQRQAIQERPDSPLRILDTLTHSTYVLLPGADYERVRALFEDEEFRPEELVPLIDEVAANEGWRDPSMRSYDSLDPRRSP